MTNFSLVVFSTPGAESKNDQPFGWLFLYPQADSNRCCGNENPESWATRRWGRVRHIIAI